MIHDCRPDDGSEFENHIRLLEELLESTSQRNNELFLQLAEAQSQLGDARAEVKGLEAGIDAHYEATFGHSSCFQRDEELWAHLTNKDGKVRKWPRESLPPRQEFRAGCRAYEDSLFGPED